MNTKRGIVWSLINQVEHPELNVGEDLKISNLMPIVEAMFPGIEYFSTTGFYTVMKTLVVPALKKNFPELDGVAPDNVAGICEIPLILACNGYEWGKSAWHASFQEILNR